MIDTSFMVGLANPKDKYHKIANDLLEKISEKEYTDIFISDYVIDEFLNIVLKGRSIEDAIEWGEIIFSEEIANIVYCNQKISKSAWELFQSEKDERKPMNFTDCIVFIKYQSLKCNEILTFDNRLKNYSDK